MSEEFRNEDSGSQEPLPPARPRPPPMHWFLKLLLGIAVVVGIGVLGIIVLAGLLLATCALGR